MRKIITDIDKRLKPRLKTPEKGSDGDLTVQSDLPQTDINNILARYAGNLAELKAWQDGQKYGDGTLLNKDLLELHDEYSRRLDEANVKFTENEALKKRFASFDEYYKAVLNGYDGSDLINVDKSVDKKEVVNDEKKDDKQESK